MFGDLNVVRFILLAFIFVVSILFLIISPNVICILLGWDGCGLVSYLLEIYYQNVRSYGAGAYATRQRPTTARPTTFHVCKTRGCVCSFRLLMMGGCRPKHVKLHLKQGIIKFCNTVASCLVFHCKNMYQIFY